MSFPVGHAAIGQDVEPFVIAEMSGNHNGSLENALKIVDAAVEAGAHALKLQTYTPDTITLDVDAPDFRVTDAHGLWGGRRLYDLYEEAHTPWEWHEVIFERARAKGLTAFSAPFDVSAVEFLESLEVPLYKVASAEIVDLPLIRAIASTGKPMIMSTGMATVGEIDAALRAARGAGARDIVLLACTASYPADPADARLSTIAALRDAFDVPVGLSDHTRGIGVAIAAVALGAVAIEKHLTLDRSDEGVDSDFSLEPSEFASLCAEVRAASIASRSQGVVGPRESELPVLRLRRSLYVSEDVEAGDLVTTGNVRSVRPAGGLPPDCISTILGRRFKSAARKGTPMSWELV